LDSLEASVREYLGWKYVDSSDALDLTAQQQTQAHNRVNELSNKVDSLVDASYVWSCYPEQSDPRKPFTLELTKVSESAGESLSKRVAVKLLRDEQLIRDYAASSLGWVLHKDLAHVWQRGDIAVGELWGYFTHYLYMDRLLNRSVLDAAVEGALTAITFGTQTDERFALASDKDADTGRYIGLIIPPNASMHLQVTDKTLLVGWEKAHEQLSAASQSPGDAEDAGGTGVDVVLPSVDTGGVGESDTSGIREPGATVEPQRPSHTRYFGAVKINSNLYARELASINREILERIVATGATLNISLEIEANKPEGFTEGEMRTIKENGTNLRFEGSSGFEEE
jgi:hypothetical protein